MDMEFEIDRRYEEKSKYCKNSSLLFLFCIILSNMIIKYFSKLLRPPMAAMDVGADVVELHLGISSSSVGLKMEF